MVSSFWGSVSNPTRCPARSSDLFTKYLRTQFAPILLRERMVARRPACGMPPHSDQASPAFGQHCSGSGDHTGFLPSDGTQRHFRNMVGNHELGLGRVHDLGGGNSRAGLEQGCPAVGEADHRQLGDDQIHRT